MWSNQLLLYSEPSGEEGFTGEGRRSCLPPHRAQVLDPPHHELVEQLTWSA
jgi:hypothetical protein